MVPRAAPMRKRPARGPLASGPTPGYPKDPVVAPGRSMPGKTASRCRLVEAGIKGARRAITKTTKRPTTGRQVTPAPYYKNHEAAAASGLPARYFITKPRSNRLPQVATDRVLRGFCNRTRASLRPRGRAASTAPHSYHIVFYSSNLPRNLARSFSGSSW